MTEGPILHKRGLGDQYFELSDCIQQEDRDYNGEYNKQTYCRNNGKDSPLRSIRLPTIVAIIADASRCLERRVQIAKSNMQITKYTSAIGAFRRCVIFTQGTFFHVSLLFELIPLDCIFYHVAVAMIAPLNFRSFSMHVHPWNPFPFQQEFLRRSSFLNFKNFQGSLCRRTTGTQDRKSNEGESEHISKIFLPGINPHPEIPSPGSTPALRWRRSRPGD
jgi:hypothetical protein